MVDEPKEVGPAADQESPEAPAAGEGAPAAPAEAGGAVSPRAHPKLLRHVRRVVKEVTGEIEKNPAGAKVLDAIKEVAVEVEKSPLVDLAHKVLLAGIGAAALAQDEMEAFLARLVERGEIAEADAKKMLQDVLEKRRRMLEESAVAAAPQRAADELEKRVEAALARLNIPTKDEIEALNARIAALTRKVDELKKGG